MLLSIVIRLVDAIKGLYKSDRYSFISHCDFRLVLVYLIPIKMMSVNFMNLI